MATGNKKAPLVAPKRSFGRKKKPAVQASVASSLASRMMPGAGKRKAASKKAKPAKRKPAQRKKAPIGNPIVRFVVWVCSSIMWLIWWVMLRTAIVLTLIVGGSTAYYYSTLPEAAALMDSRERGSVTMLDRKGDVFAWRGDQFGGLVDARSVAPQLRNAVVATEDKRFYRHMGLSPRGIAGAIRTNMREGRHPLKGHGGSTITQQVAKRVYFSDMGSIERKLKEVPMSLAMELKYTKDEILTIYLNRAYLGAGSHGFEAASQRYFSKSASEVTVAESAMLAGLLKAPSSTAPTRNMSKAQGRANLIIGLMEDQGYLTQAQAAQARANPAQLSKTAKARAGGYFADWIMESGPEFILKDSTEDLVIRTTFDKRVQKAAEDALTYIFENKVKEGSKAQAAIVVLSRDGAVRALVGGRKSGFAGDFNRATQALRQTGSSFKPFVYAAALETGFRYDSIVVDEPITIKVPGSKNWSPKNYTKNFLGEMTMTTAMAKSINTVAVKVSEEVGRERVRALAHDFGIKSELADGPALALGVSESTLLEMTGAYAGILNSGRKSSPYGIQEITLQGDTAPLMGKSGGTGVRVISDRAAQQLVYMMNQVVETGSGRRARIDGIEAAGKTGTTQGARDAWFIGFTGDFVTGVWMGYDDNSKLSGVTGSGLPADIWRETMVRVHDGVPATKLPMIVPAKPADVNVAAPSDKTRDNQVTVRVTRDLEIQPRPKKRRKKNKLRDITDEIQRDLDELDREAENLLERVKKGLFGRKKD